MIFKGRSKIKETILKIRIQKIKITECAPPMGAFFLYSDTNKRR